MSLLDSFQAVFTVPSFATLRLLMSGRILSVRHLCITDLIVSSESTRNGHFSDYNRFFRHAAWFPDRKFSLVVDSLHSGQSASSTLPKSFDWIGQVHARAALYAPTPPETKVRPGPRRIECN